MNCEHRQAQLGAYLDGEIPPDERREVEKHLSECPVCTAELDSLRAIALELVAPPETKAPDSLWTAIANRLDSEDSRGLRVGRRRFLATPIAKAAAAAFAIGLGLLAAAWLDDGAGRAAAAPVNFGVLLDALPIDASKALRKFLLLYDAQRISPYRAKQYAPDLNFDVPVSLPGGFRLQAVYALRFGEGNGVAAEYRRDGELLATVFHPPVQREDFGTHRDYPCVIGEHRGSMVRVGQWKLVHLTDPTTCHCVLSKLDESELSTIMSAVAPGVRTSE